MFMSFCLALIAHRARARGAHAPQERESVGSAMARNTHVYYNIIHSVQRTCILYIDVIFNSTQVYNAQLRRRSFFFSEAAPDIIFGLYIKADNFRGELYTRFSSAANRGRDKHPLYTHRLFLSPAFFKGGLAFFFPSEKRSPAARARRRWWSLINSRSVGE